MSLQATTPPRQSRGVARKLSPAFGPAKGASDATNLKDGPPSPFRLVQHPGLALTRIKIGRLTEHHITLWPVHDERPASLVERLAAVVGELNAKIVKHDVFGALSFREPTVARMSRIFGRADWPITWIEGGACGEATLAGMHVLAVSGGGVRSIRSAGRIVGRSYRDAWAKHCLLGAISASELSQSKGNQVRQVYAAMEAALGRIEMTFSEIVRTWLFLNDILAWYGSFNEVRTEIFTQRNLFGAGVPASTGVGARNAAGAALIAGAWAVQPLSDALQIREVTSPLQCSASGYGSCFSRAMEVITPAHRRLFVSGTASIAPDGRTMRSGDLRSQIERTMEVVREILTTREMDFSNVTRATAYFKNPSDAPAFADWREQHGNPFTAIVTQADICRDELLFELELDAIRLEPVQR